MERNAFEEDVEEVISIKYRYENLGYDKNGEGLLIYTDKILDEKGKMGKVYPPPDLDYPKKTPWGPLATGNRPFPWIIHQNGSIFILKYTTKEEDATGPSSASIPNRNRL
ncbi:MAG: hypothetical protein Q4P28_03910 [Tissierellia bacterium]|nr:hypothetical protein [Tissierellia bacterium]